MKNEELFNCIGGAATTTIMNSIVKLGNFLVGLGRTLGSTLRYLRTGKQC